MVIVSIDICLGINGVIVGNEAEAEVVIETVVSDRMVSTDAAVEVAPTVMMKEGGTDLEMGNEKIEIDAGTMIGFLIKREGGAMIHRVVRV